jgi:hypothetical protein
MGGLLWISLDRNSVEQTASILWRKEWALALAEEWKLVNVPSVPGFCVLPSFSVVPSFSVDAYYVLGDVSQTAAGKAASSDQELQRWNEPEPSINAVSAKSAET